MKWISEHLKCEAGQAYESPVEGNPYYIECQRIFSMIGECCRFNKKIVLDGGHGNDRILMMCLCNECRIT